MSSQLAPVTCANLRVGLRVRRGFDWEPLDHDELKDKLRNEDGGAKQSCATPGEIVRVEGAHCTVKWPSGQSADYTIEEEGGHQLFCLLQVRIVAIFNHVGTLYTLA